MLSKKLDFLTCLFLILFSLSGNAQEITAKITGGNWELANTWNGGQVPGPNDTVRIDGSTVIINSKITVKHLILENLSGNDDSQIIVEGSDTLTVTDKIEVIAHNVGRKVLFHVRDTATLLVGGDVNFQRKADNTTNKILQFNLYGRSKTYVAGNFNFDYKNGATSATDFHIYTQENAFLEVRGTTTLITRDGVDLDFMLEDSSEVILRDSLFLLLLGGEETAITANNDSHFQLLGPAYLLNAGGSNHCKLKSGNNGGKMTITGDITMETTGANLDIKLEVNGTNAEMNVSGDIIMDAFAEDDVVIHLRNDGVLNFGGNLSRKTVHGRLLMEYDGVFVFNGNEPQVVPSTRLSDATTDSLDFQTLSLSNTSGSAITLNGDIRVSTVLNLSTGNLKTSPAALLIIDEDATIAGAGPSAYIDGPMVKKGKSNGAPFIFPVGSDGKYAPIEIEKIDDSDLAYTAEFIGCPPPIGAHNNPLQHINTYGYWTLLTNDGSAVGDVTLHWNDADEVGLDDMNSLVTSRYDLATGWHSMGRANQSGGLGAGISGSISNDIGCPPPLGISTFGLGSTDISNNLLPVEMATFRAYQHYDHSKVIIEWETLSEVNSDFFIVEKSYDGIHFEEVVSVEAAKNSSSLQLYQAEDLDPLKGNNYYRIMQVDQDQSMSFSRIAQVYINIQAADIPVIFPNPVRDYFNIFSENLGNNAQVSILIFDVSGKRIHSEKVTAMDGHLHLSLSNTNIVKPGPYFVSYLYKGQAYHLEFLKLPN